MFAIFEIGGPPSSYVPGVFRDRKVAKISKASSVEAVGHKEQPFHPQSRSSSQAELYEQVQGFSQSASTSLVAREFMSLPVTTLPLTASLAQAWELVKDKRLHHIPIQSREGTLVGMLSDRDLSRGTIEVMLAGNSGSAYLEDVTIEPYVSHPVLVATLDATLQAIARVLLEERIGAIPVVSSDKELVGIISRSDILRVIVSHPNFEQWA